MSTSTATETPEQALERIQSMGFGRNDAICVMAFADRGIDPEQIEPRVNVLTFRAWRAAGRQVAKGATGVPVKTWVPCKDSKRETKEGEERKGRLRPKTARLFHISQTVPSGAPKGTRPEAWQNPALVKAGTYETEPVAVVRPEIADAFGMRELPNVVVREEVLTPKQQGNVVPKCNCPMAGVVTNVDCPIHGSGSQ
jgi:hypothetical protein